MNGVGLGTYRLTEPDLIHRNVRDALIHYGYRLIDTAAVYRNEEAIGEAIRECSGIERSEIFITSKLSPKDHQGEEHAYKACLASVARLGVDYIDLYLIHWPGKSGIKAADPRNAEYRLASWRALERLVDEGRLKRIGISNFTRTHIDHLLQHARIRPYLLQIEFHPLVFDQTMTQLLSFCAEQHIIVQGYSTFGEGVLVTDDHALMVDGSDAALIRSCCQEIKSIADRLRITRAQLLLRWSLQHNVLTIPKSTNRKHMEENIAAASLPPIPELEISQLDSFCHRLNSGKRIKKFCWDPENIC